MGEESLMLSILVVEIVPSRHIDRAFFLIPEMVSPPYVPKGKI